MVEEDSPEGVFGECMLVFLTLTYFSCASLKQNPDDCDGADCSEDTGILDTDNSNEDIDADGDGLSIADGDCDDSNPNIPGLEYCDGIDNDCDEIIDEPDAEDASTWYEDQDGDGYGIPTSFRPGCEQPDGYADNDQDCDDNSALISPEAEEIWYDGIDQDCSGDDDYDVDGDGFDDRMVDISLTPQFVMELHPVGNSVGNALQGLAIDVEREELWMSVDTSSNTENVLINRLSLKSGNPQYCEEFTENENLALGHGQDLTIEYGDNDERWLWIGSESDMGVTRIDPLDMSIEVLSNLLPNGFSHSTPAMGLFNQWVAVRGSKDGDSVNNDWIRVYEKSAIESGFVTGNAPSPLYEFNIDGQQRVSDMWFQGIALDEEAGFIYAITGDNTLSQSNKLLYVYDLDGNVVRTANINMDWSSAEAVGTKYEPEGLSLVKDPNSHVRYLYFTMMFGSSGSNIKRLYSIAPSDIPTGGSYSNNDIDWLIRYNTNNGDVSISSALANGEIGCETKNSTWTTGWSSFAGYFVNGEPHLLLQKENPGTTKIHPLDWDATFDGTTKDSDWSEGWSNFHTWEHAGKTYLFHYKSGGFSSGLMRTSELTNDGDTDCCLEDDYWSTGWKTHIYTLPNGDDFLLRFQPTTQNVRLAPLTSGFIGSDVLNDTWTGGYTDFTSVQSGATTYVMSLDNSGTLYSFEAQSNGLLNAIDSIGTTTFDWTDMVAYNLEGTALVHLLRSSDGYFELYSIDDSGSMQGPIETGFENNNWTSIEHFKTTP